MDGTGIYSIWCNVPYPHLIQRFSDITMAALLIIYYPHLVLCLLNNVIWERDITKSSCISNSHFSIFFNFRIRWSFLFLLSKLILFGVDRVQQHYHKNDFRRQPNRLTKGGINSTCLKKYKCTSMPLRILLQTLSFPLLCTCMYYSTSSTCVVAAFD